MIYLENDALRVAVLDPVDDRVRLGARYCTGGYIYMVDDRKLGPIISGPGYPMEYPPVFDGQGLPEAFTDVYPAQDATEPFLILGVGRVAELGKQPSGHPRREVDEFCEWYIQQESEAITMTTQHALGVWGAEIVRSVQLVHRTVRSATRLTNTGARALDMHWFPHPFYPLVPGGEACRFTTKVGFPVNDGYEMRSDGMIVRKDAENWSRGGHFQMLEFTPDGNLGAVLRHPQLGLVAATCDYEPETMPIWGNANTFSVEPYLHRSVAVGDTTEWSVTYDF